MFQLLRQYLNIALLMGRPQDLPSGARPMQIALILSLVTYIVALAGIYGLGKALAHAVIDLGCSAAFLYLGLRATGHLGRFEQAFQALCGAGAVVNTVAIPVFMSSVGRHAETATGTANTLAVFSEFLLLVWSLSVFAYILRHTFEVRLAVSVALAVAYLMVVSMVVEALIHSGGSAPVAQDALSQVQEMLRNRTATA